MPQIDLNSDLGEGFGPWAMGDDDTMMGIVTSANIACGGHAGDAETMFNSLRIAGRTRCVPAHIRALMTNRVSDVAEFH